MIVAIHTTCFLQDYRENGSASATLTTTMMKDWSYKCIAKDIYFCTSPTMKNFFVLTSLSFLWTKICLQLIIGFLSNPSRMQFLDSFEIQTWMPWRIGVWSSRAKNFQLKNPKTKQKQKQKNKKTKQNKKKKKKKKWCRWTRRIARRDQEVLFSILLQELKIRNRKRELKTDHDFLKYIFPNHFVDTYPNLYIALRVLLTTPVTVASDERSFRKLKKKKKWSVIYNERWPVIWVSNNFSRKWTGSIHRLW